MRQQPPFWHLYSSAKLLGVLCMEPPYKEKPQHRTGGNVLELEGLKDFFLAVSPEVVNLDSNLRYKVNHLYDYINSNKVNELKKYEINR